MQDPRKQNEKAESIRKRIIMEEGWYVPTLHEKYMFKKSGLMEE
jgi:hypothetical protein